MVEVLDTDLIQFYGFVPNEDDKIEGLSRVVTSERGMFMETLDPVTHEWAEDAQIATYIFDGGMEYREITPQEAQQWAAQEGVSL